MAQNGRRGRPKRGAGGGDPPEGERNSAEGGYFASCVKISDLFLFGRSYGELEHSMKNDSSLEFFDYSSKTM